MPVIPGFPILQWEQIRLMKTELALEGLLGYITTRDDIPLALNLYRRIRKQRGEGDRTRNSQTGTVHNQTFKLSG